MVLRVRAPLVAPLAAAAADQFGLLHTSDEVVFGDLDTLTQEGISTEGLPTQDAGDPIEALQGHIHDQLDELFSDDPQALDQSTQDLNGCFLVPELFDAVGTQSDQLEALLGDDDLATDQVTQDPGLAPQAADFIPASTDALGLWSDQLEENLSDEGYTNDLVSQEDNGFQPIPADVVVAAADLQGHQSDQLEDLLTEDPTDQAAQEPTSGFLVPELFDGIGIQSDALESLFSCEECGATDMVAQDAGLAPLSDDAVVVAPDLQGHQSDQLEGIFSQDEDGALDALVTESPVQITPASLYDAIGYQSDQLEELFSDEQVANDNLTTALTDAQVPNNVIVLAVVGTAYDQLEANLSQDEDGTLDAVLFEFWQPYPINGTAPTLTPSTQANRKYGGANPHHWPQAPRGVQAPRGTLKRFR